MASVTSPVRRFVKPLLFRLLGPAVYDWFLLRAKIRDIDLRLVEEPELKLLSKVLKPHQSALDIGANYAYYTVRLAELCQNVVAFEPIPSTVRVCERIVEHYGFKNVRVVPKGVGAKNEIMTFEVPLQGAGTPSAGQAHLRGRNNDLEGREKFHGFQQHQLVECEVVTIDSFLPQIRDLGFVKLDIEGAEYFALQGMRKTLEIHRPVVLIEVCKFFLKGFGITEQQMLQLIDDLKYDLYIFDGAKLLPKGKSFEEDRNYILLPRGRDFPELL